MEIEKHETPGETPLLKFSDVTGTHCSLYVTENSMGLQFDLDTNWAEFTQEDIKILLPYLQNYAQSGTLEPTLQGGELDLIKQKLGAGCSLDMQERVKILATLQEGGLLEESIKKTASLIRQTVNQDEKIESLKQLVKEWEILSNSFSDDADIWYVQREKLEKQTAHLLGDKEATKPPAPLRGGLSTEAKIYHRALETIREELTSFDPDGDCSNYDREQAVEESLKVIGVAIGDEKVESDQDKLKQLLKDWRLFGQGAWESKHPSRLIFETAQLTEEEPKS